VINNFHTHIWKKRAGKRTLPLEENDAKVLLVVRIKGITNVAPQVKKALNKLRLRYLNSAAFVKADKTNLNLIKKVENFITFGIPSRKLVSELIYKRAYGRVNKKRVPISSNQIIEDNLGKAGLICIEDLVHEIYTAGDNFTLANDFVWSFKLNAPTAPLKNKSKAFIAGGVWGNREDKISDLVQSMI